MVAELPANLLNGAEVAITGRFASMSQADLRDLIRDSGGRPARNLTLRTRLLVVGQGGLPLGEDGKPTASLEMARLLKSHGCNIDVITEESFLERLGVDHNSDGVRRRCTLMELGRILKLPGERIRAWLRQGLIAPAEVVNRVPLFDFHQVAAARTLCDLIESGLAPAEIRKGLDQLRKLLPESESPLLRVSAVDSSSRLLVRLENGQLAEPSGQLRLDFDDDEAAETATPLSFIAVARDSRDLFQDAVALELSGRLDESAETYRRALERTPDDPVLHFNLGNVLYRLEQPDAAMEQFRLAVRYAPGYVEAWNNLGSLLFESGQAEEAITAFRRAVNLAPTYEDAAFNLASALAQCEAARAS